MNPVAEALDAAADYIEVHGWCQPTMQTPDGRACLYAAIRSVTGADELNCTPDADLTSARALTAVWTHLDTGPITWQDRPGRTEFEVIDELRLTAKALREVAS